MAGAGINQSWTSFVALENIDAISISQEAELKKIAKLKFEEKKRNSLYSR